jgi:hypothetical protein
VNSPAFDQHSCFHQRVKQLRVEQLIAELSTDSDKPPDLTDLLPDNWLQSHPQHRWEIDDIRQKERARSRQQKINKRKRR